MNFRPLFFKLLPVAIVAVVGLYLVATSAPGVDAVSSVLASPTSISSGGTSAITISGTDETGTLTVSVTNALTATLTLTNCSGGNGTVTLNTCQLSSSGNGTNVLTINTGNIDTDVTPQGITVSLNLTATCTPNQTVILNAIDTSIGGSAQVFCSGASVSWITVSPSPIACGGTATITASPPGAIINSLVSFVASTGTFNPVNVTYNGSSASSTYTAPLTAQSVTFTVADGAISGTAQVPVSCSGPSTISVSAAPNSLNCGSSSFITAVTNVPGTTVILATSLGSLSPTSAVDQGGGVLSVLTAPQNQSGTATITVTGGSASGTTQVTVTCNTAAPTAVPATAVPAPPPPAQPIAVLRPPNTGDGGLRSGTPAWRLALGVGLIGLSLTAGVVVAMWKRA